MFEKLKKFTIYHDYITLFIIVYIFFSAVLAIFLGLLYFLFWILFHVFLEIYKRKLLFKKLNLEDLLIALQHCRIDFAFYFLGIFFEVISTHSFAIALSRFGRIAKPVGNLISFLRVIRVFGVAKSTFSISYILKNIFSGEIYNEIYNEKRYFKLESSDKILFSLFFLLFFFLTVFFYIQGYSFKQIILKYLEIAFRL